jgi:hypothetical protein
MRRLAVVALISLILPVNAAELAGITIQDQVTAENGEVLLLNGAGVREKFWTDVYVGSLYLVNRTGDVAEILSAPNAYRIQIDFIRKKVSSDKLVKAWNQGFNKNQSSKNLALLRDRIDRFNSFFEQHAVADDRLILDYIPGTGTTVTKNNSILGRIPGEDFKNALLEIWIGNFPADKNLKIGMLGLK